jgi:hypothetical protein
MQTMEALAAVELHFHSLLTSHEIEKSGPPIFQERSPR